MEEGTKFERVYVTDGKAYAVTGGRLSPYVEWGWLPPRRVVDGERLVHYILPDDQQDKDLVRTVLLAIVDRLEQEASEDEDSAA